uniref:Uncharacterized protein n=1 Tax=Anguilla anguilla TaxID=7936 RepID=A0A0E9VEB9_ANGAN
MVSSIQPLVNACFTRMQIIHTIWLLPHIGHLLDGNLICILSTNRPCLLKDG